MANKRITLHVEVTDEFCDDVRSTAVEGGINYWAMPIKPKDNLWAEQDPSTGNERKHFELTYDMIRFGLRKVLGGNLQLNSQIRADIFQAVVENDAGNIDATGADVIIQAAVFSEIVYG